MMTVLDATVVNVALPAIQDDLGFSASDLTWVVNAYLITFGSFLLVAGRLGDLIGRRRVFLWGVTAFAIASALCGFANSPGLLVAARLIQGVGGALAAAAVLAIIVAEFPNPRERARAMGLYMLVAVSGGSIGLLVGGVVSDLLSWHWIFFINLPIAVAALMLGRALISTDRGQGFGRGLDVTGAALVTVALMVGVYAIVGAADHGWTSTRTLGLGALAIVMLIAFYVLESRLENAIMPVRILKLRSLIDASIVRAFVAMGMYSSFFFGTLYLQNINGYGPVRTGLAFLPMTVTVAFLSTGTTARMVRSIGALRTLLIGLVSMIAGLLLLGSQGADAAYFPVSLIAFLLMGFGAGSSFLPLLTLAMAEVPRSDAGLASGIVNVSMQISAAIGLAALGTIAASHSKTQLADGHATADALLSGYHLAIAIAAAVVAVGVVVAVATLRPKAHRVAEVAPAAEEAVVH
ncbi:MFS transporter [Conexibacter sp. CPCC 206217]|uniref:MFS transporter n=1 Tax=Conexibacter sp. CPCC 206217 TaxID=3064574 RepID=UPI00351BF92C